MGWRRTLEASPISIDWAKISLLLNSRLNTGLRRDESCVSWRILFSNMFDVFFRFRFLIYSQVRSANNVPAVQHLFFFVIIFTDFINCTNWGWENHIQVLFLINPHLEIFTLGTQCVPNLCLETNLAAPTHTMVLTIFQDGKNSKVIECAGFQNLSKLKEMKRETLSERWQTYRYR